MLFAKGDVSGIATLSSPEIFESSTGDEGLNLESGDCSSSDSNSTGFQRRIRAGNTAAEDEETVPKKRSCNSRISKITVEDKIEKFYKKFPCTPIANMCKTQQWLSDSDLRYLRDNNPKYINVVDVLSNEFLTWRIKQFADFYKRPGCQPIFAMPRGINILKDKTPEVFPSYDENVAKYVIEDGCPNIVVPNVNFRDILNKQTSGNYESYSPASYYLDERESLDIVSKLLDYQTKGNTKRFLYWLVMVLDKIYPKLNSIFVYAPPSSGKNFFFDFVLNFFLIRGQMMNINKATTFPYMDCVDKRVILFNEPNISESPATIDTLKMLFGGDNMSVAVKFKPPATVSRTPVIILTNDPFLFRKVDAFNDRMIRYEWEPAPFLKDVQGYPNPIVFPKLLDKYSIPF